MSTIKYHAIPVIISFRGKKFLAEKEVSVETVGRNIL